MSPAPQSSTQLESLVTSGSAFRRSNDDVPAVLVGDNTIAGVPWRFGFVLDVDRYGVYDGPSSFAGWDRRASS